MQNKLRAGVLVSDWTFDQVYPPKLRVLSSEHWTPVEVAARASKLFELQGADSVVDIGAGPGKFCLVGALRTNIRFTGIERRLPLVEVARETATFLGVDRARFVHGNVCDVDLRSFNGIYLFNPFCEQICETLPAIDDDTEFSPIYYRHYVMATLAHLTRAAPGTIVITYYGFGGQMTDAYRLVHDEPAGGDRLRVWVKAAERS